jgi:hypothetical protein
MTAMNRLPVLAVLTVLGIAACDRTAPAVPEPTPGPVAQSSALNGTYNLLESNCGDQDSDKRLVIDGNKFLFPAASCTVVSAEPQVNRTRVTLACGGSPGAGNRIVELQSRPDGTLRISERMITLTYHQCTKASASSDSLAGQAL